jgi:endonuclease/exonuclease/phosphatase family metal-dependent hydrolase
MSLSVERLDEVAGMTSSEHGCPVRSPVVDIQVLFANTYLLRVPLPGPFSWFGHFHAKPAVQARACEYGGVLGEYDVAALCEVFRTEDLEAMLDHWVGGNRPEVALGPGHESGRRASSGLVTLADGPRIVRTASSEFAHQGSHLRDSDAWSAKGALLVEVELPGAGANLELVSTHLVAGGDFADTAHHRARTEMRRFGQVDEVMALATGTRSQGNASLIVGDFNVEAGTDSGERLTEVMAGAGYRDLWPEHGIGPGWTCDAVAIGPPVTTSASDDDRFCADPAEDHPQAERIDYAFWRPADDAPDSVTVTGLRRRVFRRSAGSPESDVMPLLSDHVALHLDLSVVDA